MKFTVAIATYNRLNLLRRAVESVLNQTIPCEVVVVDDGSVDGTQEYMEDLCAGSGEEAQRILYHRHASNQGHAGAVNTGVKIAKGDWIKFLDDDDYLAPNCLEEMTKAIALRPEAVICSCIAAQVDEHEVEISRTPIMGSGKAFYIPQADVHYGMLLELVPFGTPVQVACRRDAFLQTGGWDVKLTSCDDIDSWIRVAELGDAIFINQCLAYRTIWDGGYDQKIDIKKRLDTNIFMKEKIYHRVNQRYHSQIPALADIKKYLHLHWTIAAMKQKNVRSALQLMVPAIFSGKAWRLLLSATVSRRSPQKDLPISKIQLID
ncbi:MAG: glycosyltransferase family 2 protein [Calothrix sp. MO_167.B42]|nr:glycosyltransferase family 2 protein [Calothrix sp. MO_167.B42]